ncbi:hypothetical protein HZQ32_11020 [Elizabethkingia anophelis]|nr:hypothetical protein [Elizabethkingia anophelis]
MLKQLQENLNSEFIGKSDWFSFFFTDKDDPTTIQEEGIKAFMNDFLTKQSDCLAISILTGEYIYNKNFISDIDDIIKTLNPIYDNLIFFESTILHNCTNNFVKILEKTLLGYKKLYNQIKIHTYNPNTEIVFIDSKENNDESIKCFDFFGKEVSISFENVFFILGLSSYDHFFDESIDYFRSLINFENRLNVSQKASQYYIAITEKVFFLKYKWGIRQITTSKFLNNKTNKSYIIDNDIISINESPSFQSERKELKKWKTYLEKHYQYVENFILESHIINELSEKDKPSMLEIHALIKHFKDGNPNYENLKNVVENFEKREKEFETERQIFFKNLNYALNNQFSLLIEKKDVTDEEVGNLKIKIDALQNKIGYDNFFVDFKYLKYSIKKLEKLILNREPLEIKQDINALINNIRELIITCERKIEWSENHHNLLYQLPYEESLVHYGTEKIEKVYYASTFLLPLSVEQIQKEFFELKLEFNNKYNYLEILSTLDKEFSVIKEMKEKDVKSIELISLFTAVISFIIGGVSGFKFIEDWKTALLFDIVFSTSLISFLIVLFAFTRGIDLVKKYLYYILGFYFIFLTSILLITNIGKKNVEAGNNKFKINDTINNIYKKKLDNTINQNPTPQQQGEKITNSKTNDNLIHH